MRIEALEEPLVLRIGPNRGRAALVGIACLAYAGALAWLFVSGRLPWQDGPSTFIHIVEDLRALVILGGALFVAGWQLWTACAAIAFKLGPNGATLSRPLGKPIVLPAADVRPELVRTRMMGRWHHRLELPVGRRKHILDGGPDDHEPQLRALEEAILRPSKASYRKLAPLAAHIARLRAEGERFVLFAAIAGLAAMAWVVLR